MYSRSSSVISTTYSQDERIARALQIQNAKSQADNTEFQLNRQDFYETQEILRKHEIFKIPAIDIIKFTYKKIKFSFKPSLIYNHQISETYLFYCTLVYMENFNQWRIGREPMPAIPICRKATYGYEYIDDDIDELFAVVGRIYKELKKWSEDEIRFRKRKFERYQSGELDYMDIDKVDEELFLSQEEIAALHEKRERIWQRMLPPPPKPKLRLNPTRSKKAKN